MTDPDDMASPTGLEPDEMPDNMASTSAQNADIAAMGYEQARDELAQIVSALEGGRAPLQESMRLWERGEALAAHCQRWLDGAQQRIDAAMAEREKAADRT